MSLLVFTDLDGTLLDHGSYSLDVARPALDALRKAGVPLVLASSKTAAEIEALHSELCLGAVPAIVENGAALFQPGAPASDPAAYDAIRACIAGMPTELRSPFLGFGDMEVGDVARLTGLSLEDAARAKMRQHSEPGLWTGSSETRERFIAALAASGLFARSGGRFLTVSRGKTKADRMREIVDIYHPDLTVALGDAPNDIEMIEAADLGVIVRNDHGPGIPPLAGEDRGRIRRTVEPGPAGWNTAMLTILSETKQQRG